MNFYKKIICICNECKRLLEIWGTFVVSVKMMLSYEFISMNTYDGLSDFCCIQVSFLSHSWQGDGHFSLGFLWHRKVSDSSSLFCSSGLPLPSNSLAKILSGGPIPSVAMDCIKMTIFAFILYQETRFKIYRLIQEVK